MKTCAGIEEKSRGKAFGRKRRIRIVRIPRSSIPDKTESQTGRRRNSEKMLTFGPQRNYQEILSNENHTDRIAVRTSKRRKRGRNQEGNQGRGERSREEDEGEEELDWSTTSWVGLVVKHGGQNRRGRGAAAKICSENNGSYHLSLSQDSAAPEREREREREAAERRCDLQQRRQQPFRPLWAADEQGSLSRLGSSSPFCWSVTPGHRFLSQWTMGGMNEWPF